MLSYKAKTVKKNMIIKSGKGMSASQMEHKSSRVMWEDIESCFNSRIRTGFISNHNIKDPFIFLNKAFKSFSIKIKNELKKSMLKVNVAFSANFIKPQSGEIDLKTFCTKSYSIDTATNLKNWYQTNVIDPLRKKLEEFAEKDSGWALLEILGLKVNINNYDPIKFGYSTFTHVPKFISKRHAVINVKNDDEYCFLWAVVSALFPTNKHSERKSSYPHYRNVLSYENIKFPITFKDIKKFEKINNLSINLYCIENKKILPCCLSDNYDDNIKVINLLMLPTKCKISNQNIDELLYHFTWIKNLSALLSNQLSSHGHKAYICERCLNYFKTQNLLQKHKKYCNKLNQYSLRLPKEKDKYLYFKNYKFQENVPFAIYADLESILEKSTNSQTQNSKTTYYQKHTAFSIAYYFKCSYDDTLSKFHSYRGKDCIQWFVNELKLLAKFCDNIFENILPMEKLSDKQNDSFHKADLCYICKKPFLENHIKVRDHNHQNGKYRGAAHQNCNLNYKDVNTVPIVFHFMSGYDAHFIIKELATSIKGEMKLLPINKERYISFTKFVSGTKVSFRFIDSFRFMSSSLEKLSTNLNNDQKFITKLNCKNEKEFNLINRKGIFPYDYIDSWEKLDERRLPPLEAFYSQLHNEKISNADYEHALNVWNTFNIQTLGEYSDLYLKTDVLLLADVFEAFRRTCMNTYKLDPLHYYTAPGLTFDAMLKTTGIKLELFTDIDKALFVERGIRGGVSQCSNRFGKANNKYMGENYNPSEETSYLMYFDVNNLYGAAMSQYLPYGEFEFLDEFNLTDILNTPDDSNSGYIVECDLEYPLHLHKLHSDLPLAPEHMIPPLSKSKLKKLLLTLYSKTNYIIHYRNLKMYVQLGMNIKKIYRVLKFKQSPWLKEYIDLNTTLRQNAKNEFEMDFFKLMINAIYGKCMENVRKHKDIRLVSKWDGRWGVRSLISKPNFHSSVIFDDEIAIIEMNKLEVYLNKPVYIGFSILDISKTFLYEFHYNYIIRTFNNNAKLLYTDTDSLIYHFYVNDIYSYIKKDNHRFDTSNYEINNIFGIELKNKKVPGLMKDENGGRIMIEFVGLRSKMYAYLVDQKHYKELIKKSKGSTKASIKSITFDDYKKCLFQNVILEKTQRLIKSKNHSVFTIKQKKVVLSSYDDKRMLHLPLTDTKPWGYCQL